MSPRTVLSIPFTISVLCLVPPSFPEVFWSLKYQCREHRHTQTHVLPFSKCLKTLRHFHSSKILISLEKPSFLRKKETPAKVPLSFNPPFSAKG